MANTNKDFREEELAVEEKAEPVNAEAPQEETVTEEKPQAEAKKDESKKDKPKATAGKAPNKPEKVEEELVPIFIPHIDGEPDQEFYSVNDRDWIIKKGEEVMVPRCLAEAIRNSNKQVKAASDARASMEKTDKEIASL